MSFFQETIRGRRAASIRLVLIGGIVLMFLLVGYKVEENRSVQTIIDVEVEKHLLELNPQEGKWYFNETPFNGYAIVIHKNGNLAEKTGFLDGKREGPSYKWYDDGMLSSEKNYRKNRLEGVAKTWWPNGQQSTESNYQNRKRHGVQIKWYPSGQMARLMQFNQGKEEGLQQAWLRTGKLYANYEAKNGRFFGLKRSNLCYQLQNEVVQK